MVSAIRFGTPRRRTRVPAASPVWTPPPGGSAADLPSEWAGEAELPSEWGGEADHPCARRRQLDRCLVGHHLHHRLVFGHTIPDADQPLRHLGFGKTLPDIREPELVPRHQSRVVATIACRTRSALGM